MASSSLAPALSDSDAIVIIENDQRFASFIPHLSFSSLISSGSHTNEAGEVSERQRGQVAQVVERSPEKAGVGGSTPSLATIVQPKQSVRQRHACQESPSN